MDIYITYFTLVWRIVRGGGGASKEDMSHIRAKNAMVDRTTLCVDDRTKIQMRSSSRPVTQPARNDERTKHMLVSSTALLNGYTAVSTAIVDTDHSRDFFYRSAKTSPHQTQSAVAFVRGGGAVTP